MDSFDGAHPNRQRVLGVAYIIILASMAYAGYSFGSSLFFRSAPVKPIGEASNIPLGPRALIGTIILVVIAGHIGTNAR